MKVQIYTPAYIYTGYVYCPQQQRLLDVLNSLTHEFLPIAEGEGYNPSAYINKANILFVREAESQTPAEAGDKQYPFVTKSPAVLKVYMPRYTLIGQAYYAKGQHLGDVLRSGVRFLPLTNVEIRPSAGRSESGVSFIAVHKGQVLSLEVARAK